ncbi:MAG: hypothetical protein GX640_18315 [Fibrobacter sp.]|nr:hypothetical protein [Fibrobacter sp.]
MQLKYGFFWVTAICTLVWATDITTRRIENLTPAEKSMVEDSRMPQQKLQQILEAGVSIEEYFQYPWLKLDISEPDWLNQRKAGLIKNQDTLSDEVSRREWAVVQNFFLPGYHQLKRHQRPKGFAMAGIAFCSLVLYALHRNPENNDRIGFDYPIYLFILGADQLWSSIDIGIQVYKEIGKDASRFSYNNVHNTLSINYLPFSGRTKPYVSYVSQW